MGVYIRRKGVYYSRCFFYTGQSRKNSMEYHRTNHQLYITNHKILTKNLLLLPLYYFYPLIRSLIVTQRWLTWVYKRVKDKTALSEPICCRPKKTTQISLQTSFLTPSARRISGCPTSSRTITSSTSWPFYQDYQCVHVLRITKL